METIVRWLGIAFFAALIIFGLVIAMRHQIRYSWMGGYKNRLSTSQKIKFSAITGMGVALILFSIFPLISLISAPNDSTNQWLDNFIAFSTCAGPGAIFAGIVVTSGEYFRYGWFEWLIQRNTRANEKSEDK
jgi:hypothetical protein